jgi:hypothetical protein
MFKKFHPKVTLLSKSAAAFEASNSKDFSPKNLIKIRSQKSLTEFGC